MRTHRSWILLLHSFNLPGLGLFFSHGLDYNNSLGSKMGCGKKEHSRDGSGISVRMTQIAGGDFKEWGWKSTSKTASSLAHVSLAETHEELAELGLSLDILPVPLAAWPFRLLWRCRWFQGWARQKRLHVVLRSHLRNHMVLPPIYVISRKSRSDSSLLRFKGWTCGLHLLMREQVQNLWPLPKSPHVKHFQEAHIWIASKWNTEKLIGQWFCVALLKIGLITF